MIVYVLELSEICDSPGKFDDMLIEVEENAEIGDHNLGKYTFSHNSNWKLHKV